MAQFTNSTGSTIINDHNNILEDVYFDGKTSNGMTSYNAVLKFKQFCYIDHYFSNYSATPDNYYLNQSFTWCQDINKRNDGYIIVIPGGIDGVHMEIDIYGGSLLGEINVLNNNYPVNTYVFGRSNYDHTNTLQGITLYTYVSSNQNDIITTAPIMCIDNTSYSTINAATITDQGLRYSNKIIFNFLYQPPYAYTRYTLNDIKNEYSTYNLLQMSISENNIQKPITIYIIYNTKIIIISPFYLLFNDNNVSKIEYKYIGLKSLTNNAIFSDTNAITNNDQFALKIINDTCDYTADIDLLNQQIFSDDFLNKYDIRKKDPTNYNWINNIIDNYSFVSVIKNSLIMFIDINNGFSIKDFIKDVEKDTETNIYTKQFLTMIVDNFSQKPLSFKNLVNCDKWACESPNGDLTMINRNAKMALNNLNNLNSILLSKLINEIDIDTTSDLYSVSHFCIPFTEAARYISISPEVTDKVFPDGIASYNLNNIKNTIRNIPNTYPACYQFVNISEDQFKYFIKYFCMFKSNIDYVIIHTHGSSSKLDHEYIYLGTNSFIKDSIFLQSIRHTSKNVIVFSLACFSGGLIDKTFNGYDITMPTHKTNCPNNIIFFYADTASSSAITNTVNNLNTSLLMSAINQNDKFIDIINNYNKCITDVYVQINEILLQFYYNLINFIDNAYYIIIPTQYKTEIELNIIPQDIIETCGNMFRAEFNIFYTLYHNYNNKLSVFNPMNSIIQFIRFIFCPFSCDEDDIMLNGNSNINTLNEFRTKWKISIFMHECITSDDKTLLFNLIGCYFQASTKNINELVEYICKTIQKIMLINKQFQRTCNLDFYHKWQYIYFIADYPGVLYHIKDTDFLNKNLQNIIYG